MRIQEIALCDRAGVSWLELQQLPGYIVDGYKLDLDAQAEAARRKRKARGV